MENPHVMSMYATQLECLKARDKWWQEREAELEAAVFSMATANAWQNFGECRSFGSDIPILQPNEVDYLAKGVLGMDV